MKDYTIVIASILLVLTTSLNSGQKINDFVETYNERRSSGMLAQPRVGRTMSMLGIANTDGITGLVHYPRVGRTDRAIPSSINFYHNIPPELNVECEFMKHYYNLIGLPVNSAYQRHLENTGRIAQSYEALINKKLLRSGTQVGHNTKRNQKVPQLYYCDNMDKLWTLFCYSLRDSIKLEKQSAQNYEPEATREIDHVKSVDA